MLRSDIHRVYLDTGKGLHSAGRFLVHDGQLRHLEDYHGLLSHFPEGAIDDLTLRQLGNPPAGVKVASEHDIQHGHRVDVVPPAQLPPLPRQAQGRGARNDSASGNIVLNPPPVFHYQRAGHDRPHLLEVVGGKVLLDGNALADDEVHTVLRNVKTGVARIRYAKSKAALAKADEEDMDPQEALAHLDRHVGQDPEHAKAIAALRRRIFEDPMTPGLGNKYAYQEYRKKNPQGIWASIDVNDLRHLNSTHGHEGGDALIRAMGQAARAGADPKRVKLFRAGGDEFVMHVPGTTEEAAPVAYNTMRQIRHHLDQTPPIMGTHRPTFSVGFGTNFEGADKALYAAKARKMGKPGLEPHLAHSAVPGSEGPIPLDQHEVHLMPPPAAIRTEPAAAPSSVDPAEARSRQEAFQNELEGGIAEERQLPTRSVPAATVPH